MNIRRAEIPRNYVVHMAGAGAVYQEKLQGPLGLLGKPEERFIYDINPDRLREVPRVLAKIS